MSAIVAAVLAIALAPAPAPQASTPVPSSAPSASGSEILPSATPAASPSVSPTPTYNFVYRATPSPGTTPFPQPGDPEIIEIDVTDQTIAAPGPLHVRILTSDSVVRVVASSYGYEFSIPQTGVGLFTLDGQIPPVPGYAKHKRFEVLVTATAQNGRVTKLTLPFMLK